MKHILLILGLSGSIAWAQPTTYNVDPDHTSVVFKIDHMGFSDVYGIVGGATGTIVVDEKNIEKSKFDLTIKPETITTLATKRDDHLRSPDFFNVKQYPAVTLKSKSVKKGAGANEFEVAADLTMHGVTKPVTFAFKRGKTGKDPWGKQRTGGNGSLKLKRSDFNMTFMGKPGELGDEVELMFGIEAVAK